MEVYKYFENIGLDLELENEIKKKDATIKAVKHMFESTGFYEKYNEIIESINNYGEEIIEKGSIDEAIYKLGSVLERTERTYAELIQKLEEKPEKELVKKYTYVRDVLDYLKTSMAKTFAAYLKLEVSKKDWTFDWLKAADSVRESRKIIKRYL